MVNNLLQKGLIVRETDPANRRTVRLLLTDTGKTRVPVPGGEADENEAAFFGAVSNTKRQQLMQTV